MYKWFELRKLVCEVFYVFILLKGILTYTVTDSSYFLLSGTIKLMDYEGQTIYDIHVDHQLFGLTKLDITVS